jgi:hypothetical protein
MSNVWIAGAGNSEGFKFGPVVGEYVAQRVLGDVGDSDVAKGFQIPEDTYDAPAQGGGRGGGRGDRGGRDGRAGGGGADSTGRGGVDGARGGGAGAAAADSGGRRGGGAA